MKKQILFINGHLGVGGVEKSLCDILKNIDTSNYDVDVLLLEGMGCYVNEVPSEINIRVFDLHHTYGSLFKSINMCLKFRDWKCLWIRIVFCLEQLWGSSVLKLVKNTIVGSKQYDCVIGFRPGIATDLAVYAANGKKKMTWWHHGEINLNKRQLAVYEEECNRLDNIVTVSMGCRNMLANQFPKAHDKLIVIPNMIDSKEIRNKANVSLELQYDKTILNFLTVARLSQEKHAENAIYVAKKLKELEMKFHWNIMGDGVEMSKIKQLVIDCDVMDVVTLLGSIENPYNYMHNSDLLIHTSYIESQCLVVLEAMSLGLTCVVTESLGPKEFVVDGLNCFVVKQNVDSLMLGIIRAVENIDKWSTINEEAKITVEQYNTKSIIQKIEQMFGGGG